jgi:two-component system sensor histidine kinase BaeS
MKATKLHKSLVTRITVLAIVTGIAVFCSFVCIIILLRITAGPFAATPWIRPTLTISGAVAIILGIPLLIAWLASRLITKPLKAFDAAIALLQANNYKTRLSPTGIPEFDKVFSSFNTLTQRLHTEEKLRKDLISDTSHELKTPLTALTGQLIAVQEGRLPLTKERIAIVQEQTDRLTELVNGLDLYTRARMPSTAKPEPIHVKQLCQELINGMILELKEKGTQTKLDIADKLVVQASRKAVQQILQNLLQNTLRYSEATMLTIAADEHHLQFSDNGKGVPEDNLPYLFERFYRVEKSRNRASGGLGLGLAIVKELVEQQGWVINAKSADPGLSFIITF